MENVANLKTEVWVDNFTLELFDNFKKENYEGWLNTQDPSSEVIVEELMKLDALEQDAEQFIEIVGVHFTGYSCDHTASTIAEAYSNKYLEE